MQQELVQKIFRRFNPVLKIILTDSCGGGLYNDVFQVSTGRAGIFDHAELGAYVRQIHTVKGRHFGYPDRHLKIYSNWPETFKAYIELILNDCFKAGAIDRQEQEWFSDIYARNQHTVKDCDPCLLHLDLWSANILTENGHISAILDWDRGLYGDPELEFAVLDTYGYSTPGFFKGYGRLRPSSGEASVRQKLYMVYELIKYAFIRLARGRSPVTARRYVDQCKSLLKGL